MTDTPEVPHTPTDPPVAPDVPSVEPVLSIRDLNVAYRGRDGSVPAVRGLSLDLYPGEVLTLVGESGSGKSTVGHAILGLLPSTADVRGDVIFQGQRLADLTAAEFRRLRGNRIGVIFQDALAALTPTMTVGEQLLELYDAHTTFTPVEARAAALEAIAEAFADPQRIFDLHPFHLSGGMAQRVMITMATALKPDVVIADEPTSSLDPAIRNDTLERIERIRDSGTAVLLITHDFGVVARIADRVNVMYAGEIVEDAAVRTVFRVPRHPYTYGLLRSIPSIAARGQLTPMRGNPPDMEALGPECPFLPRCNKAIAVCRTDPAPRLTQMDTVPGHLAACYNPIAVPLRE
jgi:oligopeptide/dipeptide ABC transporter ATP-binding protein